MASLTIRPGARIRLKGQAAHIPDFLVVRCDRDRCWIRQHGWNPEAELNVRFTQILIPEAEAPPANLRETPVIDTPVIDTPALDNVLYMDDYRQRRAP